MTVTNRDHHAIFPESWNRSGNVGSPSAESDFLAQRYSTIILGAGSGTTRIQELQTAHTNASVSQDLALYAKVCGLHSGSDTDEASWGYSTLSSQGVLAVNASAQAVTNRWNGWRYADILGHLSQWVTNRLSLLDEMFGRVSIQGFYLDNYGPMITSGSNSYTLDPSGNPTSPVGYSDTLWEAATRSVVQQLSSARPTKNCYFNSYVGFAVTGQRGLEALQYASGMFMEGWAYKTNTTATPGYWDTTRFRQQISDCVTALASFGGRKVIVIDDFNASDTPRRLLRLGAYLLAYDGTANLKEMCRVFDGDANLNYPVEYDNALAALGNPLSVRTDDGTLLSRNYQYGRVIVNPSASDVVTSVSGRAEKMSISGSTAWNNLGSTSWSESSGSVTVPARSSLVLRYRPVSSFTRTPKIATPPATVTVNASGSSDQAQGTLEYNADFGAGYVGWQDNATFTKLFEAAGIFTILVKARNKTTGLDSNASSLTVTLTEDGISGPAPLTVTLDVSGSIGAVGLTYQFDFDEGSGPGNWSSTATATHVYNSPGTFHPRVRAQTPDGVVGAWFSTVVVVS